VHKSRLEQDVEAARQRERTPQPPSQQRLPSYMRPTANSATRVRPALQGALLPGCLRLHHRPDKPCNTANSTISLWLSNAGRQHGPMLDGASRAQQQVASPVLKHLTLQVDSLCAA
jgi:hypothetical protein